MKLEDNIKEQILPDLCPQCGGEGKIPLGEHYFTREMAIEMGDENLEGQYYAETEYGKCDKCRGGGLVEGFVERWVKLSDAQAVIKEIFEKVEKIRDNCYEPDCEMCVIIRGEISELKKQYGVTNE